VCSIKWVSEEARHKEWKFCKLLCSAKYKMSIFLHRNCMRLRMEQPY